MFPIGWLFPGAATATVFIFTDMLDGQLARIKGSSGKYGAFLDSTMDRLGDAAIFGGITIWFMRTDHLLAVVSLFCLAGGMSVSYVKARAEGLGLNADVGLIERPERLIIGLTAIGLSGLGIPYVLPIGMWGLAAGTAFTLCQRMRAVYVDAKTKAAQSRRPSPRPGSPAAVPGGPANGGRVRGGPVRGRRSLRRPSPRRGAVPGGPVNGGPVRGRAVPGGTVPGGQVHRGRLRPRAVRGSLMETETFRERLASAAFGAGWNLVCRLPESIGARAVQLRRRRRLAPPGPGSAGPRGQPGPGPRERTRLSPTPTPSSARSCGRCRARSCAPTRATTWRPSACRSSPTSGSGPACT